MEEETYYSDGTNWVTNQRLILGDVQYPLGDAINAELKAEYPEKVLLARIAIVVGLAILFGLVVFLDNNRKDPFFAGILRAANTIALIGIVAMSIHAIRAEYLKQLSIRKILLQIGALLLLVVLVVWFFVDAPTLSLTPVWGFGIGVGSTYLRILGKRGTFRIRMVERIRTVDVFSSGDRQLVENLIGYIRLALVKRPKAVQTNVKSLA